MRDRARMSMRRGTAAVVPFFVLFGLAAAGAGAAQPPDALVVAQSSTAQSRAKEIAAADGEIQIGRAHV